VISTGTLSSVWSALGTAVLQFLWQGLLVGVLAALALRLLRRRPPSERYAVAAGALLLCVVAFVASFVAALGGGALLAGEGTEPGALASGARVPELALVSGAHGIAAWGWLAGVLCMAVRFALHDLGARRLRTTAVSAPSAAWRRVFEELRTELGVTRAVRLLESGLAEVPMVVGWLSPVVLVPASAFTGLGSDQLRALLAHELAHVRRHDHLVNAVQAVVEIVLFFHPVVWWISKQVRAEREYCCDDSSVRVTGDPRLLAGALAAMEALRIGPTTRTALAANGGPLMQRIARILGTRPDRRPASQGWRLPAGLALAGVLTVAGSAYASSAPAQDASAQEKSRRTVEHQEQEAAPSDLELHARRIEEALANGTMTEEEAKRALVGLHRRQELAQHLEKIRAAVKAGRMTDEEAHAAIQKVRRAAEAGELRRRQHDSELEAVHERLKGAVAAGDMTKEEAQAYLEGYRERLAAAEREREDPAAVLRRIEQAVAAGELTPEQGREKIEAYRRALATRKGVDPKLAIEQIRKAVEAGELTPDEGRRRIARVQEDLAQRAHREKLHQEVEETSRRIRQAVETGTITAEEGRRKLLELRKKLGAHGDRKAQHRAVIEKLEAAVEAGELTREEAHEKLAEYEKQLHAKQLHEAELRRAEQLEKAKPEAAQERER
jgi:beta-lactamase regulating signal transducer with metallopeptidase domain/polyhydroxyalkanoate synthesis regulator phasin